MAIGYEFLRTRLGLKAFPPRRPASVQAVTRIDRRADALAVPQRVAPASEHPLEHLLFALRYEGTNLQILAEALHTIAADEMVTAAIAIPSGEHVRKACYLWEEFTGRRLPLDPRPGGAYVGVFDPTLYFTDPRGPRSARWRVAFNGLGTLRYCPMVERSDAIRQLLEDGILERLRGFIGDMDPGILQRTLEWAYLSETRGSFAIEGEAPPESKAQAFAALLREAHARRQLDEDRLVELQNAALTDPWLHEQQFRAEQNWLRRGGSGALSVTYVPPPAAIVPELMDGLLAIANDPVPGIDPLVTASLVSFGFVFVHPFLDGNGRLSRYLIHHCLCQGGVLEHGALLPISIAMQRHEVDYLAALVSYSGPARRAWNVTQLGADEFAFEFTGKDTLYRFWDATPCVEFGLRMAKEAVDQDLMEEATFLRGFDQVFREISSRHEVRNNDLAALIRICHQAGGHISRTKRDIHARRLNPVTAPALMDDIERVHAKVFGTPSKELIRQADESPPPE